MTLKTVALIAGLFVLQAAWNMSATADDRNAPHPKADGSLPQRPLTVLYKTDTRIYFGKGAATPLPASVTRRLHAPQPRGPDIVSTALRVGRRSPAEVIRKRPSSRRRTR